MGDLLSKLEGLPPTIKQYLLDYNSTLADRIPIPFDEKIVTKEVLKFFDTWHEKDKK